MKAGKIAVVSAIAAVGLAMFGGANVAMADCTSGHLCVWANAGYSGTQLANSTYTGSGRIDIADNQASSVKNTRSSGTYYGCAVVFPGLEENFLNVPAGTSYNDLSQSCGNACGTDLTSVNDMLDDFTYGNSGNNC